MHKRTGLRKPQTHLKTWGGPGGKDWTRRLSPRLRVGRVDEDLPVGTECGRKSWYLSLTLDPDLLTTLGPVKGIPNKGKTVLLFEDDVIALAQYLLEGDEVALVRMDDTGRLRNGEALDWELRQTLVARAARRQAKRAAARRTATRTKREAR